MAAVDRPAPPHSAPVRNPARTLSLEDHEIFVCSDEPERFALIPGTIHVPIVSPDGSTGREDFDLTVHFVPFSGVTLRTYVGLNTAMCCRVPPAAPLGSGAALFVSIVCEEEVVAIERVLVAFLAALPGGSPREWYVANAYDDYLEPHHSLLQAVARATANLGDDALESFDDGSTARSLRYYQVGGRAGPTDDDGDLFIDLASGAPSFVPRPDTAGAQKEP